MAVHDPRRTGCRMHVGVADQAQSPQQAAPDAACRDGFSLASSRRSAPSRCRPVIPHPAPRGKQRPPTKGRRGRNARLPENAGRQIHHPRRRGWHAASRNVVSAGVRRAANRATARSLAHLRLAELDDDVTRPSGVLRR
jgi:hypothetical protein